ncbi:6861_t:CDS:2, partial [Cetraspora pellucida]
MEYHKDNSYIDRTFAIISSWFLAISLALTVYSFSLMISKLSVNKDIIIIIVVNVAVFLHEIIAPFQLIASSNCSEAQISNQTCADAPSLLYLAYRRCALVIVELDTPGCSLFHCCDRFDQDKDRKEILQDICWQKVLFAFDMLQLCSMCIYRIVGLKIEETPTYIYAELCSTAFTVFVMTRFWHMISRLQQAK